MRKTHHFRVEAHSNRNRRLLGVTTKVAPVKPTLRMALVPGASVEFKATSASFLVTGRLFS